MPSRAGTPASIAWQQRYLVQASASVKSRGDALGRASGRRSGAPGDRSELARRAGARPGAPPFASRGGDLVLDPGPLELEEVELHRLGARRLALGAHHHPGDVGDQFLVVALRGRRVGSSRCSASQARARAATGEEKCSSVSRSSNSRPRRAASRTSPAAPSRAARARSADAAAAPAPGPGRRPRAPARSPGRRAPPPRSAAPPAPGRHPGGRRPRA